MTTPVFSLVLSPAVNYAQLHISHRLPIFIPHLQIVVYHSITSKCLFLQYKMSKMYITLLSHLYLYTALLQSCLSGNCLCDTSFSSITLKSAEASMWLHCYCPFLCSTACPLSEKYKAGYLLSDGMPASLVLLKEHLGCSLSLGFPCWLMKKHFHDFFISFTAIKG